MKGRFFPLVLIILALATSTVGSASVDQEMVAFSGSSMAIGRSNPGKCIAPDRLMICRSRSSTMQIEVDDARWSGEARLVFDSIYSKIPYKGYMVGDFNLENQEGSWEGIWKGSTDTEGNTLIMGEALGSGGYEGLVARWQMNRSSIDPPGQMIVSGTVQKIDKLVRKR